MPPRPKPLEYTQADAAKELGRSFAAIGRQAELLKLGRRTKGGTLILKQSEVDQLSKHKPVTGWAARKA